jgi:hypothetical protein
MLHVKACAERHFVNAWRPHGASVTPAEIDFLCALKTFHMTCDPLIGAFDLYRRGRLLLVELYVGVNLFSTLHCYTRLLLCWTLPVFGIPG